MHLQSVRYPVIKSLILLLFILPAPRTGVLANQENGTRLPPPLFSHESGFYGSSVNLNLSTTVDGAEIYYTLDGSTPDPDNLDGTTYNYKNTWIQNWGNTDGSLLTGSYTTLRYSSPVSIVNPHLLPDRLARKASAYYNPPYYFPSSPVYKGRVVRAVTVKEGFSPSEVVTHIYFIGDRTRYSLPVITVTTSEDNLFDYYRGIYTPGVVFDNWRKANPYAAADGGRPGNYHQRGDEWEYPAHFTFWDAGSSAPDLSQDIGIRIHGGWSRSRPMKSLRLYARSDYGNSTLAYPFFPDQDYNEYKRLMLRNSGNDNPNTMFRDALIQGVCRELNFDTQAYRPAIVFLNGEYWGIHNIRERYDRHYIERVYGVRQDDLDLLTGMYWRKEGNNHHYVETLNYIEANGLQEDVHYQYIKTRIDTENFIDYQIANIYSANTDWPANNIDFWRKRTEYQPHAPHGHDGRWRWMAFDMDFGFGIWGKSANENVMRFATATDGPGWPNPPWSTFLLRSFLKNASFKADFVNRFAGLLNTSFRPERVIALLEEYQQALEPEMPEHIARWKEPVSMDHSQGWQWNSWYNQILMMRNFVIQRPAFQWGHLMDYFGLDTVSVSLSVSSAEHGYIRANDIDIIPSTPGVSADPYPWRGTYFSSVPVTFEAVPLEGYRFSHWEGVETETQSFSVNPSEAAMITAHFVPAAKLDMVHLWHFNNLTGNQALQAVTADYSAGEPGVITYPGEGEGYMDRVADGSTVNLHDGYEPGYGLRVRNPSHTRELIFSSPSTGFDSLEFSYATRRTPNGAWNQSVYASADGGGNWIQVGETTVVSEDWQRVLLDLSGFPQLGDNPAMKFKILFGGETAPGESGNNRFDNITIKGRFLPEITSYYNKPDGSLNETSSWGSEPDGSGQAPASFDIPGAVYHIHNGGQVTLSGDWAVSGMLSGVVLGGGDGPVTFTIPPAYSFTGPIDVGDNAVLVIQNSLLPGLKEVSPLSTVVFEQNEVVTIPARSWGSLHLKGGVKVFYGDYLVPGNFRAEDTGLSFEGNTTLTLKGDLAYAGNVTTQNPENVNILATGTADQLFLAEGGILVDAYNFYAEKEAGTLTAAADIYARNNLRLDFSGSSLFIDGGHTLKIGDDLRISGNQNRYRLTGTIMMSPETGTNDIELSDVPLHNLVINATGDARVDFNLAAPVIRINNDLVISSRSSRPVRLRDKRFSIRGNMLLDLEQPGQVEQGESMLAFNGENLQILKNLGYGGPGLLENLRVHGGGLQLDGIVTIDSSIELSKGIVHTGDGNLLKLGPGGTITQGLPDSYIKGPMGIYNNSRETAILEFPVGKQNGLHRIVLEAGHVNESLRLFTAEYFDGIPPQYPLDTGISRLLENHGWYSITTDGEEEISNASVIISYAGETYPADSLTIATVKQDGWVSIGSEPVPDSWRLIRSTSGFDRVGIFTLAVRKGSPLSSGLIERIFNVYPNPVSVNGRVYLPEIMDVTLVSSSGITVLSAENVHTLSLEGIPPGVYLLKNRQGWHARIIIAGR
jgi:hypothetical protein